MELISVVVGCDDVQQEDVFRFRVQSGDAEFHLWKHLSGNRNDSLSQPISRPGYHLIKI